jgi:hypothetical protein
MKFALQSIWTIAFLGLFAFGPTTAPSRCSAGDLFSGTYLDPALQRQDLFSHHLWNSIPEHRAIYNRPAYLPGYLANKIEPSSQEAMAWKTNYCNGSYKNHACGNVPLYYYPKPWEALNTRSRPDFVKAEATVDKTPSHTKSASDR